MKPFAWEERWLASPPSSAEVLCLFADFLDAQAQYAEIGAKRCLASGNEIRGRARMDRARRMRAMRDAYREASLAMGRDGAKPIRVREVAGAEVTIDQKGAQ